MESWLIQITNYLLAQSWQIAVLTIVVAIVSFLLRNRSAHVRYLLWLIVLAKCLIPPLYSIPVAVLPQQELYAYVRPSPIDEGKITEYRMPEAAVAKSTVPASVQSGISASPKVTKRPFRYDTRAWLAIGWLVGVVVLLLYYLLNALRTQIWLLRRRKALPNEFTRNIESLFKTYGVKHMPRVWLLERISQPFVWGLVRGSIYLPTKLLDNRNAKFQPSLLGHELSHVIRFDATINSLQVVTQAVFWFHPFVWWANRRIRAEREKCCDEMTIARLNALPEDYGEAIVETLAARYEQARPVPSLAVAGQVKNIEERIRTMLRPGKKFYRRPTSMTVAVALLFAVCAVPTTLVLTTRAGTQPNAKSLHEAVIAGNVEQVKSLIDKGADINTKNEVGRTPLHEAAYYSQREVAKVLIAKGANVNATDSSGKTPLYEGVRGTRYVCELLIANGARVNARDNSGNTPLHYAAGRWYVGKDLLELLVVNGADVNARNDRGEAPLHLATPWRNTLTQLRDLAATFLLANGSEVNARDNSGRTPLHFAAGSGNEKVVKLLLAKGADIKAKAANDATALHWAASYGRYDIVELLLDNGAEVNGTRNDGWTALHCAAEAGRSTVAELLITRGADVNAESKEGKTPLDLAGLGGHVKLCALLTAKGAKIHSLCSAAAVGDLAKVESFVNEGSTPDEKDSALFAASACGQENVVEWLISKGTHVSTENKGKETALHLVARGGYIDVAKLLLANGANVNAIDRNGETPLHYAASSGRKELVALLIAKGADVNARDRWEHTPLDNAVWAGHKEVAELLTDKGATFRPLPRSSLLQDVCWAGYREVVEFLIQKGVDVNAKDWRGEEASLHAAWRHHADILELLVAHGADVNAADRYGWSLLHITAWDGNGDMTKMLLDKGANPNVVEREEGQTPLHYAVQEGKKTIAEMLLAHGANVNAKDFDGNTPLSLAKGNGHTEIVELLKKYGAKE
jgi:ankyrin repeat protein/beta-lactamase regulating signal transducer with metallopeptidase domain